MPAQLDVAIVGSGFAGSILARMLARRGRRVALIDRERHPRFAIGESATPLAGLALERIGREYDLPDLIDLASYGRWTRRLPGLRRGLKRGFTFYAHRPGHPYANGHENDARLLVAASPSDDVADAHWLRADVDAHLAARAAEEGVELMEGTAVRAVSVGEGGVVLEGGRAGTPLRVTAEVVVDATGAGSLLAGALPIASTLAGVEVESGLVGAHFAGVRPFARVARSDSAHFDDAPYPEACAAVHHLLEEGWLYALPFDDGVVSAGLVLRGALGRRARDATERPALFRRVLERYPSLAAAFRDAEPVSQWLGVPRLQRRLARAAGPRWLVLPHAFAFVDPMFSTGIAWSLLGVRRAARLLAGDDPPDARAMAEYDARLRAEADRIEQLIAGALRAASSFRLFCAWSFLYFSLVAWAETRARLGIEPPDDFLGACTPGHERLFELARRELERALAALASGGRDGDAAAERFESWVAERIAPFDVVGLADPARRNLYPVDLELLVQRAHLLGMTQEAMREALPRLLRGT